MTRFNALALLSLLAAAAAAACQADEPSPLAAAAAAGRADTVARLLAGGADPNGWSTRGITVLGLAARTGRVAVLEQLVSAGADPNLRDRTENEWTPLLHAVHKHQRASVQALLRLGANPDLGSGLTPLIMAAGYGNSAMVKLLLDGGADPYLTMKSGENALGAAVIGSGDIDEWTVGQCQTDTVKLLLARAPKLPVQAVWFARPMLWPARLRGCDDVLRLVEDRNRTPRAAR
jgi:uncharacterized protein